MKADDFNRPWWETHIGATKLSQDFIDKFPDFCTDVQTLQPTFEPLTVFSTEMDKPLIEDFDNVEDFTVGIEQYDKIWADVGRVFHSELGRVPTACLVTQCRKCGATQWMAWSRKTGIIKHGYSLYVLLNVCFPMFTEWIAMVRLMTGMQPEPGLHKKSCPVNKSEEALKGVFTTKG